VKLESRKPSEPVAGRGRSFNYSGVGVDLDPMDQHLPSDDDSLVGHGLVEIEIPSRVDLVAVVRMIVAAATSAVDAIQGDRLDDLRWVTSEATTNAIEANLANNGAGRVVVRCEVSAGVVRLTVSDEGEGFSPPPATPEITDPERLLIEGAFGLPLMQHLSSAMSLHSGNHGTTVEMELHQ